MALKNLKNYESSVARNKGIAATDQIQLVGTTTVPADSNLANGRIYYDTNLGGLYAYINSAWVNLGTGGAAGITSWDGLYDNDKVLDLDGGVLTFTVSTAANGLYINKTNAGAGVPLIIGNSGTGYDLQGPSWSIISTGAVGILELTSAGTINAAGGALTIGKTATATSFAGTITVAEGATFSDGTVAITDNSNLAAALSVANATLTDYAGMVKFTGAAMTSGTGILATFASMTTGIGLSIVAIGTTSGSLVKLTATEATLTTGLYIQCYDGAANDFSVGKYGATVIAGNAATDVFTITAGDVVLSDSSITLTDADDATSLSVTNNTNVGTNSSLVAIAGSGVYIGSTTKSFVSITPSGLTTGTAVYLPLAGMTTGKGLHITAGTVLTTGSLLYVQDTGAACAITSSALAYINETATTANANRTGQTLSVSSARTVTAGAAADDFDNLLIARVAVINGAGSFSEAGAILNLTNTVTNTAGAITDTTNGLEITMSANGTGSGIQLTHSATAGRAINISSASTAVSDVLITATGAKADNKACLEATNNGATAAGGSILRITNTGTPAAATSYLIDFDYSGATMTNNPAGIYIHAGSSTNNGVEINGNGATASGKGLLAVLPAGAIAAGGAGLAVIAGAITPAAATSYLVNFNYSAATMTNNPVAVILNAGATTAAALQITGSGAPAGGVIEIINTGDNALGSVIKFDHQSAGPAASDVIGRLDFYGKDAGAAAQQYAKIDVIITDTTAASEDADIIFSVATAGTVTQKLQLDSDVNGIIVGSGAAAKVTSSGAYDLVLDTNSGSSSGAITITDGANGDITIQPNGTGQVLLYAPTWTVTSKAAGTTLTVAEGGVILANTGIAGITLVLPAAATSSGLWYTFKKTNADATALTIDANGAELIDGAATHTTCDAQYDTITIVCDGTGWHIVSKIIA